MREAMRAANDNMKAERIQAEHVAAIIGAPVRTVQVMAARGELPTAAKIGRRWTFNEGAIRDWLRGKETQCQNDAKHHRTPIGAVISFGGGLGSPASLRFNGPLAQTIQRLRRDVSRITKPNSLAA